MVVFSILFYKKHKEIISYIKSKYPNEKPAAPIIKLITENKIPTSGILWTPWNSKESYGITKERLKKDKKLRSGYNYWELYWALSIVLILILIGIIST